jgi:hypothetical protein
MSEHGTTNQTVSGRVKLEDFKRALYRAIWAVVYDKEASLRIDSKGPGIYREVL